MEQQINDEELYLDQSLINDFFAEYEDAQIDINNAIEQMMIAAHHECVDGSGYPLGLTGDNICDAAKILAIGDAYWTMTNDRMSVYKKKSAVNALMDIN